MFNQLPLFNQKQTVEKSAKPQENSLDFNKIQIIKSKRRTISLEINQQAQIIVRVPKRVDVNLINKFLKEKQTWILKKQQQVLKRAAQNKPKKFEGGEEFYYLGEKYRLIMVEQQHTGLLFNNYFFMDKEYKNQGAVIFNKWYKKAANEKIHERLNYLEQSLNIKCYGFKITSAKKRWGSCNHQKNLTFSWRLIMAPLDVIDYVIIHELMHIKEMNHSKKFWQLVASACPDYKNARNWLKHYAPIDI